MQCLDCLICNIIFQWLIDNHSIVIYYTTTHTTFSTLRTYETLLISLTGAVSYVSRVLISKWIYLLRCVDSQALFQKQDSIFYGSTDNLYHALCCRLHPIWLPMQRLACMQYGRNIWCTSEFQTMMTDILDRLHDNKSPNLPMRSLIEFDFEVQCNSMTEPWPGQPDMIHVETAMYF